MNMRFDKRYGFEIEQGNAGRLWYTKEQFIDPLIQPQDYFRNDLPDGPIVDTLISPHFPCMDPDLKFDGEESWDRYCKLTIRDPEATYYLFQARDDTANPSSGNYTDPMYRTDRTIMQEFYSDGYFNNHFKQNVVPYWRHVPHFDEFCDLEFFVESAEKLDFQ